MADEELPKKYDQAFFLDLALNGKVEKWNEWWRAHEDVRVTFADTDFSVAPNDNINFSGFQFGNGADFSGCKWLKRGSAWFNGANFGVVANFAGATFGDHTDFTGAAFGDDARFLYAAFGDEATFTRAAFGNMVAFNHTTFAEGANFSGAVFRAFAAFDRATFGYEARFTGAAFGNSARFIGAVFGSEAKFTGAAFGNRAQFEGTEFGNRAKFVGTSFGYEPYFVGASFGSEADFAGATFGRTAFFFYSIFKGSVDFTAQSGKELVKMLESLPEMGEQARKMIEERLKASLSRPDRFLNISFASAQFFGEANFSGRSFEREAIFTNTRFYSPPNFDAATNLGRIDFTGAQIGFAPPGELLHWTEESRVPIRLRAFRKIAEETKNHDLERDLYIEERKAERGVCRRQLLEQLEKATKWQRPLIRWRLITHWLWIGVMGVYGALADYGRNFLVPAIWLGLSVPFFYWRYTKVLAPLMHEAGPANADKYNHAVRMLAFGNAVPFVGPLTIDADVKKFLFCPGFGPCLPIPPEGYQFLVLGQNLLSITLVFFIGLALRNYFKIK